MGFLLSYLDAVVVALNLLYGVSFHSVELGKVTLAQRTSHGIIVSAAMDLHARLAGSVGDRQHVDWSHFEKAFSILLF